MFAKDIGNGFLRDGEDDQGKPSPVQTFLQLAT